MGIFLTKIGLSFLKCENVAMKSFEKCLERLQKMAFSNIKSCKLWQLEWHFRDCFLKQRQNWTGKGKGKIF